MFSVVRFALPSALALGSSPANFVGVWVIYK